MNTSHELNFYNYGITLSAEGIVKSWILNNTNDSEQEDDANPSDGPKNDANPSNEPENDGNTPNEPENDGNTSNEPENGNNPSEEPEDNTGK